MPGIFISYRRSDTGFGAGRLNDDLGLVFGKDLVFQDIDDIKAAEKWKDVIHENTRDAKVMLVLVGPHWLEDAEGRRRLDDPKDVLRNEILQAMDNDLTVMPVLLGKTDMPSEGDLPDPLKPLCGYNAIEISESRWQYDVGRLIERLRELIIPKSGRHALQQAHREMSKKQEEYLALLDRSPADALELADRALESLDRMLPVHFDDPYLQVVRGYFHKNRAMALQRLQRYDDAESALTEAERVFDTMIRARPKDASAWNGKANVELLRGNAAKALPYSERAIELDPNNKYFQGDHQTILRYLP
jgi:tetratricopeptide (TPR) repeat protein